MQAEAAAKVATLVMAGGGHDLTIQHHEVIQPRLTYPARPKNDQLLVHGSGDLAGTGASQGAKNPRSEVV